MNENSTGQQANNGGIKAVRLAMGKAVGQIDWGIRH
jgi:hypothetical protein